MAVTLPHVLNQLDEQYKNILLGFNTDKTFNIYDYGCLLLQLSQVCFYYGHPTTPAELNEKLKQVEGFVNGGEYVWGSLSKIYADITEERRVTPNPLTDGQMQEIRNALDMGYPVIAHIDYNPKTVKNDMHFVTIINYNPQDENDFTITDPLGGRTISLKQYLAWFKPSARNTIEQYIIVKGPVPQKEEQKPMEPQAPQPEAPNSTPLQGVMVDPQQNDLNVKMASQWKDLITYLEIPKPPEETLYKDAQRVIAGIKSRVTDLENQKITAEKRVGELEIILSTKDEEIGTLSKSLTTKEQLHKAEIDALKSMTPNVDKLKAQYESIVRDQEQKIKSCQEELKAIKIQRSDEEVEAANDEKKEVVRIVYNKSLFDRIVSFFTEVEWPRK